jgi:hypothetical protein
VQNEDALLREITEAVRDETVVVMKQYVTGRLMDNNRLVDSAMKAKLPLMEYAMQFQQQAQVEEERTRREEEQQLADARRKIRTARE